MQWCIGAVTLRNAVPLKHFEAGMAFLQPRWNAVAAAFRQIFTPRLNFACYEIKLCEAICTPH